MKEIVGFLKQRRSIKYSIWMIIFGLIFALTFQANKVQIPQILEKPIRIVLGSEEARQYQVFGWQGAWAKGEKSILKVSLPEEKTYQMVIKTFSCSPPDVRDQRIEVHFNNVALGRLKFRKTPRWQKFSVNIPPYLLQETNAIKFIYTQDTSLSPIAFDSLEFRNYIFRIKGLYLLYDPTKLAEEIYSPGNLFIRLFFYPPFPKGTFSFKVLGYSLGFLVLFFIFSLFCARFFSFRIKIELSKGLRLDLFTYLPSLILFSLFALVSFFSPYNIVYSLKTFFILAIVPTIAFKTRFICRASINKTTKLIIETILSVSKELWIIIKKIRFALKPFSLNIKTFRKFLVKQHKENLSSAFILDFMLLLVLCAFLLMVKAEWIAEQLANLAYFLLFTGVIMKAIQFFKEGKKK